MRRVDLSNFNLNLLLALDGLLSQRSVTAAAKRVRVTPSAMSHSLSELRHLLGDPLLVRSGRGMVLTPRAEALVSPLHTLLMDAERLLGGGATFDPATTARRFVIAAPDFLATLLMPALLDAVAREAPELSGKALQRAGAALASRKTPTPFDRTAARLELEELVGRAGANA